MLALQSFHFGDKTLDSPANHSELQHEPKFGGFPLSIVNVRARELTGVSPRDRCLTSEMTIDSAVVLIFEHDQLARKFKLDQFPCTRDEWYKYIFWPVHANGGNYPSDPRANTEPYAQLATATRAPKPYGSGYRRGSTVYPRTTKTTEELGRLLNRLELRQAPRVRLRLRHASLSAYQRAVTPKLKPQYQSSTVPTTAPTPAFASLVPVSSVFTNQQQGESTQDARTVLSSVRSWSDRRNSSPTPSLDNTVPSFMRVIQ